MDIIEEAKKELGSGLVTYTEFVLDFKRNTDNIYCFFEGKEDRNYYSFRTKMIHHSLPYYDYVCNGKGNLIKLYKLINNHQVYRESNIGYFVDCDFEGKYLSQTIYTTPFYSIENFYVIDGAFENILINEFNINRSCDCFSLAKDLFSELKNKFHKKILHLNAWLACQSDYRKENGISTRLNIEDSLKTVLSPDSFSKIVNQALNDISFPEELSNHTGIEEIFVNAPKIDINTFNNKVEEFKKLKGDECFRGKFELQFLISFLNRFKDEIGKKNNSIFPKRYTTSLRFEYVTAISQLTNDAITPNCLIDYIRNIKNVA